MFRIKKQSLSILERFLKSEASGGLVMIFAMFLAFFAANGATASWYESFIEMPVLGFSVSDWVKDVLMVLFFLLVGLELKREMLEGFLVDKSQVLLPLLAAVGGMAAPALVFFAINHHIPENHAGWAIPSATDIAFALCILMLVGKRVPAALKIFLLAIAIFDDLGAILIIAFFYSGELQMLALLGVAACCAALFGLNRLHVANVFAYLAVGVALWFALHAGGIHTTIGGVLTAFAIPMRAKDNHSPLDSCMHYLHPWVAYGVLPLFAFTSAGVSLSGSLALTPLVWGVAFGLFAGKQVGIFLITFLLVKLGVCCLPENTRWGHIYGVSLLAGIGFTMSLFIGMLAFDSDALHEQVKIGVLLGSFASSVAGYIVLRLQKP